MKFSFTRFLTSPIIKGYVLFLILFFVTSYGNSRNVDPDECESMTCRSYINISLNAICESEVLPEMILTVPPLISEPHDLELTNQLGIPIVNDLLTFDLLWTEVTVKVTNTVTGNSCWGKIKVEDKRPPRISCDNVTVDCYDDGDYYPSHLDNCTNSKMEMLDENIFFDLCHPTIIKTIERIWVATDDYGNVSEPCIQHIMLRRLDLNQIDFPDDLLLDSMNNLTCKTVAYDSNGFPSIDSSGVPTANGIALFPTENIYCGVGIDFEDFLITDKGCIKKFMRTWRAYQGVCGGPANFIIETQTIEVADTEIPTIDCPPAITISTGGGASCETKHKLKLPTFSDDCSGPSELDISYDGPFLNNVKQEPEVTLKVGIHEIEYTIYDACERHATCSSFITVMDNSNPVAVCDESTVVSLRSSGTAIAPVASFDKGSYDDCDYYKTLVRRTDNVCDCDLPEFNDMSFVGERNGKYYYISSIERFSIEATNYSEAMGGHLFVAEDEDEYDWVFYEVRKKTNKDYLIGLKDKQNLGSFDWINHAFKSFYKWGYGQPTNVGQNVIVNTNGFWEVFDGDSERALFVMELSDKCGFSEFVNFCCQDAAIDPVLIIRAVDIFGRTNDCTLSVEVQDKLPPSITCPKDLDLGCNANVEMDNLDIYGVATATDLCFVDDIVSEVEEHIDHCGEGYIKRLFIASDATGQSTCIQTITLTNDVSPTLAIKWPEDYLMVGGCNQDDLLPENLPVQNGFPDLSFVSCSTFTPTYKDQKFSFTGTGGEVCLKILRTWTVVDDCLVGTMGYVPELYSQSIKVINNEPPTFLTDCEDIVINTMSCTGVPVPVEMTATDDCSNDDSLEARLSIDFHSDGMGSYEREIQTIGRTIQFDTLYPIGKHLVIIEFGDGCGNKASCAKNITVNNVAPPKAKCVAGLSVKIQNMDTNGDGNADTPMAMIFPRMLDAKNASLPSVGSYHPCGYDFNLSFSSELTDTVATFDCSHLEIDNVLDLWATDEFGHTSSCTVVIDLQKNDDLCDDTVVNMVEISGDILTEYLEAIDGVSISLEGSYFEPIISNEEGRYAFPEMEEGGFYTLYPTKNDDPLNGVSTLDLVKIQRHILGLEILDSPYKLIAADIDRSGTITAVDMIHLRKLILGIYEEFPKNSSWRMVDAGYSFVDTHNPFSATIPESYDIFKPDKNMKVDFVGVKIGDVDNSVQLTHFPNDIEGRSSDFVSIEIKEELISKDALIEIPFTLNDVDVMDGFQLELSIDNDLGEIVGFRPILPTVEFGHVNTKEFEDGIFKISWNSVDTKVEQKTQLFALIVRAKKEAYTSQLMKLNSAKLHSEIYINGQAINLRFQHVLDPEINEQIKLYQNVPNPWSEFTEVKFYVPESKHYTFSLYNVNGKLVYQQMNIANVGLNYIELDKAIIGQSGVLFYELIINNKRLIEKMIILK